MLRRHRRPRLASYLAHARAGVAVLVCTATAAQVAILDNLCVCIAIQAHRALRDAVVWRLDDLAVVVSAIRSLRSKTETVVVHDVLCRALNIADAQLVEGGVHLRRLTIRIPNPKINRHIASSAHSA